MSKSPAEGKVWRTVPKVGPWKHQGAVLQERASLGGGGNSWHSSRLRKGGWEPFPNQGTGRRRARLRTTRIAQAPGGRGEAGPAQKAAAPVLCQGPRKSQSFYSPHADILKGRDIR